jgi:hypothetical protein
MKGSETKLEIHEANTIEGFFKLKKCWNNLLEKSKDNSPVLTWEHTYVSVKNLKNNQSLRILYITSGSRIVAIAPLRNSRHKLWRVGYDVIEPLDYGSATDYTGFILSEREPECLQIFLTYLYYQNNWNFLSINDTPETSTFMRLLTQKKDWGFKFNFEKGEKCPYMTLPDSMNRFLNNLKPHHRKVLRWCLRSLERDHGKVELKEYHQIGSLEYTMGLFFDLHQKRWTSRGKTGAFSSDKIRTIFLDRAKLFAPKGWLGLYFLTVNDKSVAAYYSLKYNKKLYLCLTGFDPEYYKYSVSNLLLVKVVEECINQGFTEFDFMKGEELYKSRWTREFRYNFNVRLINRRLSAQIIALVEKTRNAARAKISF